jgi:hypothetical protein
VCKDTEGLKSLWIQKKMPIIPALRTLLRESKLSFEEVRAFEVGIETLSEREQMEFYTHLSKDPELLYPIYIHYKAKARAIRGSDEEWQEAVENEVRDLEEYMSRKRVGGEVS